MWNKLARSGQWIGRKLGVEDVRTGQGWVCMAMVAYLLFLVIFLLAEKTPWEVGIADKLASGERIRLPDYIDTGLWWGALVNLIGILTLLLTARWWLSRYNPQDSLWHDSSLHPENDNNNETAHTPSPLPSPHTTATGKKFFYIALLILVVVAGIIRAPRITQSLWNDEEYSFRRYIHGEWELNKQGELEFDRLDWDTTLWANRGANNHVVHSIIARSALSLWEKFHGLDGEFEEWVIRLIPYLAGLAGVLALGVLGARMGLGLAGLIGAGVMTLHPWHLRYSVEARGYPYMLLFTILMLYFLVRALEDGRWRWFVGFGLSQFLMMWSFPGAAYYAFIVNAAALAVMCLRIKKSQKTLSTVNCQLSTVHCPLSTALKWTMRLGVASATGALAILFLMGPCVPQIRLYLARDIARGEMGRAWFLDVWAHVTTGLRKSADGMVHEMNQSFDQFAAAVGGYSTFFMIVFPIVLVCGAIYVWNRGGLGGKLVALVVPLAPLLAVVHNWVSGNFLFSWYIVYLLPGLCLLSGAGAVAIGDWTWTAIRKISRKEKTLGNVLYGSTVGGLITGAAWLVIYGYFAWPALDLLRTYSRQPLREVAHAVRGEHPFTPDQKNLITVTFGTSAAMLKSYDPWSQPLQSKDDTKNVKELQDLIKHARETNKDLVVIYAGRNKAQREMPELVALVEDQTQFDPIQIVYGMEEMFTYYIVKLRR